MESLREPLQEVFRDVFDDPGIVLRDDMTADDVDGWDSLMHINLIIAVERRLGVKFTIADVSGLKEPGQNVGTFLTLIHKKIGDRS
jgi:acyl carrier protein